MVKGIGSAIVFGGAGFLGAHLCAHLLSLGYKVYCVDSLVTGHLDNLPGTDNPDFCFIRHDICVPLKLDATADYVFNLACPASPYHYQKDPVKTMRTCVEGTFNALELALNKNAVFFQASTSEVYGDPTTHPQSEDYKGNVNPVGVRACYDEGKRAAEALCFDFYRQYGLNVRVARIFNTYGPGMQLDDSRAVSNFVTQALTGRPITIYGDGRQTRSFCYVEDTISGLMSVALHDGETRLFNIGNPEEYTILDLADLVVQRTGSKSEIVFEKLPKDDPRQRRPDISKAKQILKWSPKTDITEGIDQTITWFEKKISWHCAAG